MTTNERMTRQVNAAQLPARILLNSKKVVLPKSGFFASGTVT
jgi:hypothetical protein